MIQAPRGTKDIFPENIGQWHFVEEIFKNVSSLYGYQEIRTPIFEKTEVFSRSIGEATDIVNKEMYTFTDKGGESLTLRPELTASLVRSLTEHSMIQRNPLLKLWYYGPIFRYERPQKGRMRQFHQYGAECIGSGLPESDIDIILLANNLIQSFGIKDYKLILNSLGDDESRKNYKNELIKYFNTNSGNLSQESKSRLESNPLRILDSKFPEDKDIIQGAPNILDYLNNDSTIHFESVKKLLDYLNVQFEIQPQLVRGLDYYCHTIFEFQHSSLGAQNSFGGGGRYNGLFEQFGGKPVPAVGFAFGVERILIILESLLSLPDIKSRADVFLIGIGKDNDGLIFKIGEQLRSLGLNVMNDLLGRSLKSQMREANRVNVKYVIIFGEEELKRNILIIKNMKDGSQQECEINKLSGYSFI